MRNYLSYRRYRRGKNRCFECGMKLSDKKHRNGDHEQIFKDVLKWTYSKPMIKLFKKTKMVYDGFLKHNTGLSHDP